MGVQLKTIGLHLLGWVLFFGLIIGFVSYPPGRGFNFSFSRPSFLLFATIYVSLFYGNAYLLIPKLYLHRRYLFYFAVVTLLLLAVYSLQPFDRLITEQGPPPFRK